MGSRAKVGYSEDPQEMSDWGDLWGSSDVLASITARAAGYQSTPSFLARPIPRGPAGKGNGTFYGSPSIRSRFMARFQTLMYYNARKINEISC